MKYEIIYFVKNFKNYDYRDTLKEAMEFSKTVDALKINKGRKVIKEFMSNDFKN